MAPTLIRQAIEPHSKLIPSVVGFVGVAEKDGSLGKEPHIQRKE